MGGGRSIHGPPTSHGIAPVWTKRAALAASQSPNPDPKKNTLPGESLEAQRDSPTDSPIDPGGGRARSSLSHKFISRSHSTKVTGVAVGSTYHTASPQHGIQVEHQVAQVHGLA